ncbi:hypothetical protein DEIGR_103041 [Deinococcus grandis]|uniref:Uncharacterized protein n=1 Tax=Deinococcus grandis TaxID=57498 RepID=A0A100HP19_9DEIO|nr:hypothetical protein [Deinococcus grandis]BBN93475.1 hypothetical protein DEGR_02080 [Deinococcus grandis]GAQ23014.1 hypothetical protein DEIGR_103041 [Deinococcus grandis]
MNRALLLLSLPALLLAPARAQAAQATKTTLSTCGAYTVKTVENGFEDPPDRVTLSRAGVTYATVEDTMVSVDWCRDVTGDGVPEVLLAGFSGGAHCCFTHHLYSLTSPPRKLLTAFSAHSDTLEARQLDGRGPLELVGSDWRFAYGYGMSFAESAPLPVVYSLLPTPGGARFVENTRAFAGFMEAYALTAPEDERFSGGVLVEYATRVLTRGADAADGWARGLEAPFAAWLANYGPDIQQDVSDVGMWDWPTRAGVNPEARRGGIGGAFLTPGTRAYLGQVIGTDAATLRLYRAQGSEVVAGPVLLSVPVTRDGYGEPVVPVWPQVTVRRASGRDDALLRDARSGSVRYLPVRLSAGGMTELKDDALGVTARLLGDLSGVAGHVAAQFRDVRRTPEQQAEVRRRVQAAVTRAQPWLADWKGQEAFELERLGNFTFSSVRLLTDTPTRAQAVMTTTVGFTDARTDSEYVNGERFTMIVNLARGAQGWGVTDWTLVPRTGELYEE